jgi:branched-chain amino acid transport system permease protein
MHTAPSCASSEKGTGVLKRVRRSLAVIPVFGWLLGATAAVLLEYQLGDWAAFYLGLPKIPALFGATLALKEPSLFPAAMTYVLLVYVIPTVAIARVAAGPANRVAAMLDRRPLWLSALVHLALLYAVLHLWTEVSDYRLQVSKLTLIAVILTLSINVINGYMGEFSCSHPGFMALGAYSSSAFTLLLFTEDRLFGAPLLPEAIGPFFFPLALLLGGTVAALGALVVAIPSFRTRGDYLALISLAVMFIVKSLLENLEAVGGPRGMSGQPHWSTLPAVFAGSAICLWIVNNFVQSTMGKALNAVRDNEMAADAMTVNTRRTKMTAFLFGAFWAGVAGGLYAHELRYVNPSSFGIQMLSEALRPLELFKWIIIPLLLIAVMILRPSGLLAFREFNIRTILSPRR